MFGLVCEITGNAKILIERFPELIDLQNQIGNMYTPIHASVVLVKLIFWNCYSNYQNQKQLLLKLTLGNDTSFGSILNRAAIPILLNTGLFSVMERDNSGKTPVAIFAEFYHFLIDPIW